MNVNFFPVSTLLMLIITGKSVLFDQEDLLCPYRQSFSVIPTGAEAVTHRKGSRPATMQATRPLIGFFETAPSSR
jgi:hypothetical protein